MIEKVLIFWAYGMVVSFGFLIIDLYFHIRKNRMAYHPKNFSLVFSSFVFSSIIWSWLVVAIIACDWFCKLCDIIIQYRESRIQQRRGT